MAVDVQNWYDVRNAADTSAEVISANEYTDENGDTGYMYHYYTCPELYEEAVAKGENVGTAYVVDPNVSDALMEKWQSEGKAFDAVEYYQETIDTATPLSEYQEQLESGGTTSDFNDEGKASDELDSREPVSNKDPDSFYSKRENRDTSNEVITTYEDLNGNNHYAYYSSVSAYENAVNEGREIGTAYVVDPDVADDVISKMEASGKDFNAATFYKGTIDSATSYEDYKEKMLAEEESGDKSEANTDEQSSERSDPTVTVHGTKYKYFNSYDEYVEAGEKGEIGYGTQTYVVDAGNVQDGAVYAANGGDSAYTAKNVYENEALSNRSTELAEYLAAHPDAEERKSLEDEVGFVTAWDY